VCKLSIKSKEYWRFLFLFCFVFFFFLFFPFSLSLPDCPPHAAAAFNQILFAPFPLFFPLKNLGSASRSVERQKQTNKQASESKSNKGEKNPTKPKKKKASTHSPPGLHQLCELRFFY